MIEQIRMLPMIERVPLFLAFCFFVIAYLVNNLRPPAVDSASTSKAIRYMDASTAIGFLLIACALFFGFIHFL